MLVLPMAGTRALTRILGAYSTASDLVMFTIAAFVMLYQANPGRGRVAPVLRWKEAKSEPRKTGRARCSAPGNVENSAVSVLEEVREDDFGRQVVGLEVNVQKEIKVGLGKLVGGL